MELNPLAITLPLLIGITTNIAGKYICEKNPHIPRPLWWIAIIGSYAVTHFAVLSEIAFIRMVCLCIVLLLGMKVITYAEWIKTGGKRMSWIRWLSFSFLWFGMQPKAWVGTRRKLAWSSHMRAGLLSILFGATGLSIYVLMEGNFLPLSFVFMSLTFHYGVLRLNTAFWRFQGFPVRALFKNPLTTTGFQDFWGTRWNLAYSQMMARTIQKPLTPILGQKATILLVFFVSGLFHEFAITIPVMNGYGLPTLFFMFHGVMILIENGQRWFRYICLASLIIGIPILFPESFVEKIILPVEDTWRSALYNGN